MIAFKVRAEPQSAARPRVTSRGTYTPPETHQAQAVIGWHFRSAFPGHRPDPVGAYRLHLTLYRYERQVRDVDNMTKNVLDALNGLAYADDSQVEAEARRATETQARARRASLLVRLRALGVELPAPHPHMPAGVGVNLSLDDLEALLAPAERWHRMVNRDDAPGLVSA